MTIAVITLALTNAAAVAGLIAAWLAYKTAADARRVAEVANVTTGADLRVSEANAASLRRALQRKDVIARAHLEVANAVRSDPVLSDSTAHGMDRLLAALDAVGAIVPLPLGRAGGAGSDRLLEPDWGPAKPDADGAKPAPVQGGDR